MEATEVAAYLLQHPEFFQDHPALLESLRIPHGVRGTLSLVERQIEHLRETSHQYQHQLQTLMGVARTNERLFTQTKQLVLALLDAQSLEELVCVVDEHLRHQFLVPRVSLILFDQQAFSVAHSLPERQVREKLQRLNLPTQQAYCGHLEASECHCLFGEEATETVSSAAVAWIDQQGVLAIGSPDAERYQSSCGTVFLVHLAEVLARILPRYQPWQPLSVVRS